MEVRLTIKEKFVNAAASMLAVLTGDEEYVEKVKAAKKECENAVVEVDLDDFEHEESNQLSIALAMYALGKILVKDDEEAMELERKRKEKK